MENNKLKHTPGPWETFKLMADQDTISINHCTGFTLAEVKGSDSESEATARLIAAAPEMLEALEKIAGDSECPDYIANTILPVINKAKGE